MALTIARRPSHAGGNRFSIPRLRIAAPNGRGALNATTSGRRDVGDIHMELNDNRNGGRVATVRYDNEAKLNVVAKDDADALAAAIERVGASPDVRAVVLRGQGERALIGGADIGYMVDVTPEAARPFITSIHDVCEAIRRAPVPVVARMSGYCLGAGLEIAASCDLRVADATAKVGMPEVQVGLPSVIEAALLPRLVGWGRAARLVYTGEIIGAEQAYDWGLVESLAPAGGDRRGDRADGGPDLRRGPGRRPPPEGAAPRLGGAAPPRCGAAGYRLSAEGLRERRAARAHAGLPRPQALIGPVVAGAERRRKRGASPGTRGGRQGVTFVDETHHSVAGRARRTDLPRPPLRGLDR